jgi:4-hydroxy-tetrahydrodipicolinate reductase
MGTVRIAVTGAAGRMGNSILRLASADTGLAIVGAVELAGHPSLGSPLVFAGKEAAKISGDFEAAAKNAEIIIDFSTPEATLEHLASAEKLGKAVVIGTTGLNDAQLEKIGKASASIPVVLSPNMSIGVNVMFKAAAQIAALVPGYDVEIVEMHHNQKKDAPSGTAMKLAQVIAGALKRNLSKVGIYGREGMVGARKKDEIAVHAVRGGDIVGDHTVIFAGLGERLELTHRAQSRDTLAAGALVAAKWLAGKKPGLYTMADVLNLK